MWFHRQGAGRLRKPTAGQRDPSPLLSRISRISRFMYVFRGSFVLEVVRKGVESGPRHARNGSRADDCATCPQGSPSNHPFRENALTAKYAGREETLTAKYAEYAEEFLQQQGERAMRRELEAVGFPDPLRLLLFLFVYFAYSAVSISYFCGVGAGPAGVWPPGPLTVSTF